MKIAIHEQLEPENCFQCVFSFKREGKWWCGGRDMKYEVNLYELSRPDFCPLKIVEKENWYEGIKDN
jgi:hypothetical protein